MLDKITEDTKIRKMQTPKKYLVLVLSILTISIIILGYKSIYSEEILNPNQLESINMTDRGDVLIQLNLPFYRSVEGTASSADRNNPDIMNIRISSKIDLTMKNNENLEVHPYTFANLKQINILNKYGKIIKIKVIK